ncbi:hypothetical protein FD754_015256, partial [Muntiacus muntjak]
PVSSLTSPGASGEALALHLRELKAPLEEYVHKRYPGLVKVVRNQKREGLIRARIEGWKVATGQVTGFFDAHVEFTAGWAEPVLSRIQENRKRVILPSIDNIKQDTFEVQRYENSAHGYSWELWCMYISPPKDWWDAGDPSLPISFPWRQGDRSFVVDQRVLLETGGENPLPCLFPSQPRCSVALCTVAGLHSQISANNNVDSSLRYYLKAKA